MLHREASLSRGRAAAWQTRPSSTSCSCGPGRSCDGLECLCRPRFFAGQLLTDDDLNRLDHYIVAKNRLRNRYLHGVGAVCGLEVVCNPCDDTVTVRAGYALGPCGEDIVVCHDAPVDVGKLIRDHRAQRARVDCTPYGARPVTDCEDARQRWILSICYDEQPSRGITSLRQEHAEHNRCGCGCTGCGGHEPVDACTCPSRRPTPVQCEPTVTCEGYRFVLRTAPPASDDGEKGAASGELGQRVQACLVEIRASLTKLPTNPNTAQLVEYCCELKSNLAELIATGAVHDCLLGQRLSSIVCPDPGDQQAATQASQAIKELLQIAIELFRSCVCSALLPPCPIDFPDDCVPLATVTVRTADLHVIDICNWSSRQFAVTMPTLTYWLGWLPMFDALRQAITRLCCDTGRRPAFNLDNRLRVSATKAASAAGPPAQPPMSALIGQFLTNPSALSGLEATVLSSLGAQPAKDTLLASGLELENPLAALALTRLGAPAVAAAVPAAIGEFVTQLFTAPATEEVGPEAAERAEAIEALSNELKALRKKVDAQARTISNLRKRMGGT